MIRTLVKFGLLAVVAVVIYNYFGGNPEEKAQSKRIFQEVGGVARSVRDVVRSETGKFQAGKYNAALDKVSAAVDQLKTEAVQNNDQQALSDIAEIERRETALKKEVAQDGAAIESGDMITKRIEQAKKLKKGLEDLSGLLEALNGKMEAKAE